MSNFERFKAAATFDKKAFLAGMRQYAWQTDPELLKLFRTRAYDFSKLLSGKIRSDDYEGECHRYVCESSDVPATSEMGVRVPWEFFRSNFGRRDTSDYVSSPSAGGNLVETEIQDKSPVDYMRPASAFMSDARVIGLETTESATQTIADNL